MRYFTEADVRRLLPMTKAISAMRDTFAGLASREGLNQVRRRLELPSGSILHSLAGAQGRYFGTKIYSTHPKHGAWFTFLLFDADTARPLAQFEANWLGQIRTGAVSGLAADLLSPHEDLDVAVIGSGFQARSQVEAVAAVRTIRSLAVWSRNAQKCEAFAKSVNEEMSIPTTAFSSASQAVVAASVIITATSAKEPVLDDSSVRSDSLILAMGSNNPQRRELPEELVRRAKVIVDEVDAAKLEAGDLILSLNEGAWDNVLTLSAVVSDKKKAASEGRPIIFKSVGLGIEDVAAAGVVYDSALQESYS